METISQIKDQAIVTDLRNFLGKLEIDENDVKVTRLGGYSNEVFKVEIGENRYIIKKKIKQKPTKVFVLYEETIKKIVRTNNFGPKVYLETESMIIEELINGEDLVMDDVFNIKYICKSIEQIARFNSLEVKPEYYQQLNKIVPHYKDLAARGLVTDGIQHLEKLIPKTKSPGRAQKMKEILDYIKHSPERQRLDTICEKFTSNLVLTHCDVYRLNLMKDTQDRVILIDYEYALLNPIGWDLVNFFCERCFYPVEAEDDFGFEITLPKESELSGYFRYYLLWMYKIKNPDSDLHLDCNSESALADSLDEKFDKYIDSEILDHLIKNFTDITRVINYTWIVFSALLLTEAGERWPVAAYTLRRIALQNYLVSVSDSFN